MNFSLQNLFKYFSVLLCFFSTWVILGAIPTLQLEGMFRQVDTQILLLHLLGGTLFVIKGIEIFIFKEKIKELNNIFFLIIFFIGVLGLVSALFNNNFYAILLGSHQIGQGVFWYFDFAILILFFSSLLSNMKLRLFFLLNVLAITTLATIFTLFPFWKGINISFFYFNDYLCYFGIICFILVTSVTKNKLIIYLTFGLLGWYLSLLDNRAAIILWAFVLCLTFFYELLNVFRQNNIAKKLKALLYSNFILSLSVFSISIIILISSLIFWKGDVALPQEIASSPLASLVVRGKLIEVILADFFNIKNIFLGEGWGRVPDLLIGQMNAWQFDQLTVGYNLHFHTHNEVFEHLFSLGFVGLALFLYLIFYTFKSSELISIYCKIGWILFFYVSCFWFFWAGTLPIFALALGTLYKEKHSEIIYFEKIILKQSFYQNYLFPFSFLCTGFFLLYGAFLTYSYTKEYKKISYEGLNSLVANQKLTEINCENFYVDRRGGDTVASFINSFPDYLKRNNIEYDEKYMKIIESLQCISNDIIFNSKANLNLITASIQLDAKLFFSSSKIVKKLLDNEEKFENFKNKVLLLSERSPKRGDLMMPFLAIALKNNKSDDINEICSKKDIQGIEGYCYLISAYNMLNTDYPDNSNIKKSLEFIKKAIDKGVLEEKVYGWWFFDDVTLNISDIPSSGIPLSPDIIYYISGNEALKLLEIVEKLE
ncbi:MAG: hypothetical protein CMJ13_07220 [Pelagibacterales bacterium]|nr:hypothetical protein [Pelagibacterales bacterium]|tara:strand:+ start:314 stop:2446 length:2133 start_codon:yes stop_codon:yes gene_type:complete